MSNPYEPETFFSRRFEKFGIDNLRGSGNATKSHNMNRAEYEVAWQTLYSELQKVRGEDPFIEATILDIGTGNGYYAKRLSGRMASYITSIDITDVFHEELMRRYPEVEFVVGDAVKGLPGCDGGYDVILAIDITQHIVLDDALADIIYNVMDVTAENGVFAFTTWNEANARSSRYEKSRSLKFYRSFFYPPRWTLSPPVTFRDKYLVTATRNLQGG